jgi:hypothetical protein
VVTFLGNRYWAFRHRERTGMGRETVLFFVLNGIGLLIQLACVATVQDGLNLQGKIAYNAANLIGIGLGTLFRFWSYRRWVWRTQEPAGGVPAGGHRPVAPAPGYPEGAVAEVVAAGLDEEATLYGRGAEEYGQGAGNYGGAQDFGRPASYRGSNDRGSNDRGTQDYGRGTADYGREGGNYGRNGNGNRSGGRHAAKR